jgi:hypothetical protein
VFGRPPRAIRKGQAKPLDIRLPGPKQPLDFRNLPAAAINSLLPPLNRDLLEGAALAVQRRLLAGVLLPTLHYHIGIARI